LANTTSAHKCHLGGMSVVGDMAVLGPVVGANDSDFDVK
jgi:hypothetical protein